MNRDLLTEEELVCWRELVTQCRSDEYHSINVASAKRRATILKIDEIVSRVITGKIEPAG